MLASVLQIIAKIKNLPPDYAEHVHITGNPTREAGGTAEVESFSNPLQAEPYIVHIEVAEAEGNLVVTCTCPATKLCLHVVAFYAVFKGIKPPAKEPLLPPAEDGDEPDKGNDVPGQENGAEGRTEVADVVYKGKLPTGDKDGAQIARPRGWGERAELYDQISAAFAKLAVLEEEK